MCQFISAVLEYCWRREEDLYLSWRGNGENWSFEKLEMCVVRTPGPCVKWILLRRAEGLSQLFWVLHHWRRRRHLTALWIYISTKSVTLTLRSITVSTPPVVAQVRVRERLFAHCSLVNHDLGLFSRSHDSLNQFYWKDKHGYTGYS